MQVKRIAPLRVSVDVTDRRRGDHVVRRRLVFSSQETLCGICGDDAQLPLAGGPLDHWGQVVIDVHGFVEYLWPTPRPTPRGTPAGRRSSTSGTAACRGRNMRGMGMATRVRGKSARDMWRRRDSKRGDAATTRDDPSQRDQQVRLHNRTQVQQQRNKQRGDGAQSRRGLDIHPSKLDPRKRSHQQDISIEWVEICMEGSVRAVVTLAAPPQDADMEYVNVMCAHGGWVVYMCVFLHVFPVHSSDNCAYYLAVTALLHVVVLAFIFSSFYFCSYFLCDDDVQERQLGHCRLFFERRRI